MRPSVRHAIKQFCKTTTLHGFKYLCSPFYIDRVGWVAWCVASACCAGALCAVLWQRFVQAPALLVLDDARARPQRLPLVALCPTPQRAALMLSQQLSLPTEQALYLPNVFYHILRGLHLRSDHLTFLDKLLQSHNLTLSEAFVTSLLDCNQLLRICRWRKEVVPCSSLFEKEVTEWGACCYLRAGKLNEHAGNRLLLMDSQLDLVMEWSGSTILDNFEFYTQYLGEEWSVPTYMSAGIGYSAQLTFTAMEDSGGRLVDTACVSAPDYSRPLCYIQCKEYKCGCSDPLRNIYENEIDVLPSCSLHKLNCLRGFNLIEESCVCPPSCNKIISNTILEASPLDQIVNTFDPIFMNLNATTSTVLSIHMKKGSSKVFDLKYPETWWSLLSSLGGIFNMFLGVGLFSALEIVFLVLVKLPIAIRRSTELGSGHH